MNWNNKYWDIIRNIYWTPKYIGLKSIPKSERLIRAEHICVPKEQVKPGGSVYARKRTESELVKYLGTQEEALNHVFNLAMSIASDVVVKRLLFDSFGFEDADPIHSYGREVGARYGWCQNVMQQDGFFVSQSSLVGVELKLGTNTSPEQVLKYIALMHCEQMKSGNRKNAGLLFVVPEGSQHALWRQCQLAEPGKIDRTFLDHAGRCKNGFIRGMIEKDRATFAELLDRLKLACVSWSELHAEMGEIMCSLEKDHAGDQTLFNLLKGFQAQITNHAGTGVLAA